MSLGNRIRQLRKQNKMTQDDLKDKLSVAKSTISQYENDINKPDIEMLNKIAKIFDVSTDYLLGNTEECETLDKIFDREREVEIEELLKRFNVRLEGKELTQADKNIIIDVLRSIKKQTS